MEGGREGRRGNACPQTLRFWKTPLDISRFLFVCKLTTRQNTDNEQIIRFEKLTLITVIKRSFTIKEG